ncbi:siphovirus ReqiPepy6 Gp37-like family protein [Streptomyces roseoverticillatus]|uniref:siphovirus ReqiPepy6 Gp37-like family protein n=1 Tax=Streptomyces roseoverticillatus TaxID=66429 RepID=UPI001F3B04F0|nr:siphovirus ReqiPepy6 Gp37-like family protein [Streptomyces roseoverticillatus]
MDQAGFTVRFCQQGSWQLLVKASTEQAELLQRGGGIAIYQDGVPTPVFTGQIDMFQRYWTNAQHTGPGSLYVGGKCDNKIAYGYLAFPGVTRAGTDQMGPLPVAEQWKGQDSRPAGGPAGQALWVECDLAFGNRALPDRRIEGVDVGTNPKIGGDVSGTLRYDNLGTTAEKWCQDKGIGYRLLWNPARKKIELDIFEPRDLSRHVRFSKELGNLREAVWTLTAPRVTRAIVACQGQGADRYLHQQVDTEGEQQWGLVAEQFVDRRDIPLRTDARGEPELVLRKNSDGTEELGTGPDGAEWTPALADAKKADAEAQKRVADAETAVREAKTEAEKSKASAQLAAATAAATRAKASLALAVEGAKKVMLAHYVKAVQDAAAAALKEGEKAGNFQVYPFDTPQTRFGVDYFVGDKVTIAIDGEEYSDIVREVTITVDDGGRTMSVAPKIGQQGMGDPLNLYKTVFEMREKLRKLEARM